jgi:hypothetical protein
MRGFIVHPISFHWLSLRNSAPVGDKRRVIGWALKRTVDAVMVTWVREVISVCGGIRNLEKVV